MRQTRDTFLHFLSDNLASSSITVNNVRLDINQPGVEKYMTNAVNVKFLDINPLNIIGDTVVEISVINDTELTALTWLKKVTDILTSAYFTPKLDYTNPASPVAVGTNIYWDFSLRFRPIYNEFYCDYRCNLSLRHRIDS